MNASTLYPTLGNYDVFCVFAYGQLEVWSVDLDEPIGTATNKTQFRKLAKQLGWNPIN